MLPSFLDRLKGGYSLEMHLVLDFVSEHLHQVEIPTRGLATWTHEFYLNRCLTSDEAIILRKELHAQGWNASVVKGTAQRDVLKIYVANF